MTDEQHADLPTQNQKRWEKFAVRPYVIADGRTPEQIERDQRLLADVRRMQQAKRDGGVDPRDRVLALKSFAPQREPTQTYEQALKGKEHWDYLPREACARCHRMPFWNGYTYDDNHDPIAHGALSDDERLDRAIERANGRAVEHISVPLRVLSDDDDD